MSGYWQVEVNKKKKVEEKPVDYWQWRASLVIETDRAALFTARCFMAVYLLVLINYDLFASLPGKPGTAPG
jgi:hypothetical protein